jgi:hypothetical protein
LARPATPSEPDRSRADARPSSVALPPTIGRADVPAVVADCLERARGTGRLVCDGGAVREPQLAAIDALARVALGARRAGRPFRLEHAGPALLELLHLCGFDERLRAADPD